MYKILPIYRKNMAAVVPIDELVWHVVMRLLLCRLPVQVVQHNVLLRSLLVTIHVYLFAGLTLH
jgi:hypothetical protein